MRLESKKERKTIKQIKSQREREREREEEEEEEIPVMRWQHGEDNRPASSGCVASSLGNNIKEKRKGWRETNQNYLKIKNKLWTKSQIQ